METNLKAIKARIRFAATEANRDPNEISLIAVSKTQSRDSIRQAYALGIRDFGENYIQEWREKSQQLLDLPDIRWHFIGHLQSNKAKLLRNVDMLHSLDSLSLLKSLTTQASTPQRVLVQIQLDADDQNKFGLTAEDAETLCGSLVTYQNVIWEGFMGIGPAHKTKEELSDLYKKFADRCDCLWKKYQIEPKIPFKLSLGMSDDLEIAVQAGSTHVRVGSALFGERKRPG